MKVPSILVILLLTACSSPMNHRVVGEEKKQEPSQVLTFEQYGLTVNYQWLKGPIGNINTDNELLVFIKNKEGELSSLPDHLILSFYATMPSMGHPLDDAGYFKEISEGIYLNKNIRYNMPGDWANELQILDENYNIKDRLKWSDFF